MNAHNLPPLIAAVANLALGALVVSKNPRASVNRAFGLLCLSLATWNFGIFMMWYVPDGARAELWSICLHLGLVFIPPTFLHLLLRLTRQGARAGWVICTLGYGLAGYFAFESARGRFTEGVQYLSWGWMPISGTTSRLFDYLFIALVASGVYYLLLAYRKAAVPVERNRLTYVMAAVAIAALASIPNFLLVRQVATVYPAGHLVNVISTAILAYVVIRYRLLEVRLALRRGLVLSGVTGFIVGAYVVLLLSLVRIAEGADGHPSFLWLALLALGITAVLRPGLHRLQVLVERRFFRQHYEGHRVLRELGRSVVGLLDLEGLLTHASSQITAALKVTNTQIFLFEPSSGAYILRSGSDPVLPSELEPTDPLVKTMAQATSPLVRDEISHMVEVARTSQMGKIQLAQARRRLEQLRVQVCVPLHEKGRLEGLLNVGDKQGRGLFSPEDIYLLSALGNQLAVAVENASLYDELKAAYDRLAHTQQQLYQAEKLATLGELAAGVAHEINNPLGSIMLAGQMMAKQMQAKGLEVKHPKIIEENVLRCKAIVSALLDFARQKEPRMVPTDVHGVLNNTIALASSHEAVKGMTVERDFAPGLPPLMADAAQLSQVFLNLIVNGAIASQPGSRITVKTEIKDGAVDIHFQDEGHGIPKEIMGKIFDPFFSTRKDGKGTGLGLSISYGIVERHGGSIGVESEVGKGSVFTVALPVHSRASQDKTKDAAKELVSVTA